MGQKYITRLNYEEKTELLNYLCPQAKGSINYMEYYDSTGRKYKDDNDIITLHAIYKYRLEEWNRGVYDISDFSAKLLSGKLWEYFPEPDYINLLREFLTKKFGKEYLDDLYIYQLEKIHKERERLLPLCNQLDNQLKSQEL